MDKLNSETLYAMAIAGSQYQNEYNRMFHIACLYYRDYNAMGRVAERRAIATFLAEALGCSIWEVADIVEGELK